MYFKIIFMLYGLVLASMLASIFVYEWFAIGKLFVALACMLIMWGICKGYYVS